MKKLFILIAAVAVSFYAVKNMENAPDAPDVDVYRMGDGTLSTNLSDYLPDLATLLKNDRVDVQKVNEQLITAFPEAFKWAEVMANDVAGTMAQDAMDLAATQSHGEILANFDIGHKACQGCHDAARRVIGK
ncbi:hypothetical protein ACFL12_05420 [Pseudomonadota bacterium]